jgi:hypothetical protein
VLAEQHDHSAEGGRNLSLDLLARCHIRSVATDPAATDNAEKVTIPALDRA